MSKVKQIRYFGANSQKNSKNENGNFITINDLTTNIISTPLCSLGIRALPGTKFYLNNNENPIIINHLGIYELEFKDGGSIFSLKFSDDSVRRIDTILSQGYIIIDMLEKGGDD